MLEGYSLACQPFSRGIDILNREVENREAGWSMVVFGVHKNGITAGYFEVDSHGCFFHLKPERFAVELLGRG